MPRDVNALAETVRALRGDRLRLMGAGTKLALVGKKRPEEILISSRRLAGILEYTAAEYTITALAGTPIRTLEEALAEYGQYLPFDPPYGAAGATLGGTVASGLAGPGRIRFGGVRDFVLAVTYVDGRGRMLHGGAKVVKNAAGFDLPKLLVGSLGRLAALAEITLKVLPRPSAYCSVRFRFATFQAAYDALVQVGSSPFDLEGLELLDGSSLLVRLGGGNTAARINRLEGLLERSGEPVAAADEAATWQALADDQDLRSPRLGNPSNEKQAPVDAALIKVALSPRYIPALEEIARGMGMARRYSAGGAVAWLGLDNATASHGTPLERLSRRLAEIGLPALLVQGPGRDDPRLGHRPGDRFLARIKQVLDPHQVFPPLGAASTVDARLPSDYGAG